MQLLRDRLSGVLRGVSRTFAINITNLSGSLYDSVLASYLVCRLFDTVEDSPFLSVRKKCEYLFFLEDCFVNGCTRNINFLSDKVQKWGEENQVITQLPAEKELLKSVGLLWDFLQILSEFDKKLMIDSICEMSQGMRWFLEEYPDTGSTPKVLRNQEHLKKYCYVVAGTIGNLLTDLFLSRINTIKIHSQYMKKLGVSFGRGLQMTNILKDTFTDSTRGWVYLPHDIFEKFELDARSYLENQYPEKNVLVLQQMIKNTQYLLKKGFLYIQNIPVSYSQIRSFCMIALFLSMKTLEELKKNTFCEEEYRNKISRSQVRKILFWIYFSSRSNIIFRCLYSRWAML